MPEPPESCCDKLSASSKVRRHDLSPIAATLMGMRMADADDLIAVDVFNAAQASAEPVTIAMVKSVIDRLLSHPAECECGHCEAAATARVDEVVLVASSWQYAVSADRRRARNTPRSASL